MKGISCQDEVNIVEEDSKQKMMKGQTISTIQNNSSQDYYDKQQVEQHPTIIKDNILYVNEPVIQQQNQEELNHHYNQKIKTSTSINLDLFQYDEAKSKYDKNKQSLDKYFSNIIVSVLKSGPKSLEKRTITTYTSVIKKFYYLTFYQGTYYQTMEMLTQKKTGLINNSNQISQILEQEITHPKSHQDELQEKKLQNINQEMLGLCLLIMFTLGVKREYVYDMQFAQLFEESNINIEDEEYNKLKALMVQLGQNILEKFKAPKSSYIYRKDLRDAQKQLKKSKEQIIRIILNEQKTDDKLISYIDFIEELYFDSISQWKNYIILNNKQNNNSVNQIDSIDDQPKKMKKQRKTYKKLNIKKEKQQQFSIKSSVNQMDTLQIQSLNINIKLQLSKDRLNQGSGQGIQDHFKIPKAKKSNQLEGNDDQIRSQTDNLDQSLPIDTLQEIDH